jgi:hypothetical protein
MKIKYVPIVITLLVFIFNYTAPVLAAATPYNKIGIASIALNTKNGRLIAGQNLSKVWHAMLIASSNEAAIALVDNSGLTRKQSDWVILNLLSHPVLIQII